MGVKERVFHTLLFEVIALSILLSNASHFVDSDTKTVAGLMLALSLVAMLWNYVYNQAFDAVFGRDRKSRTFMLRIVHGVIFEAGMIAVSFPLMMWVLALDFWAVFALDVGVVVFFLIYAIVYNWCYDMLRVRLKGNYV